MVRARKTNGNSRGFTLLEVIIAFVILALILGASFNIFSTGFRQASLSGHYADAVVRAESQMALLDHAEPLETGVRTGRFDQIYTWRTEVAPIIQNDDEARQESPYRLYDVAITVFWGGGRDAREVTLQSQRIRIPE